MKKNILSFILIFALTTTVLRAQWTVVPFINTHKLYCVEYVPPYIFIGSKSNIFKSNNDGLNWISLTPYAAPTSIYGISMLSNNNLISTGSFPNSQGYILQSLTSGNSWNVVSTNTYNSQPRHLLASDNIANNAVVSGTQGHIAVSTDMGATWVWNFISWIDLNAVKYLNTDTIIVAGDNMISISTNNGDNWNNNTFYSNANFKSIAFDENVIYVGNKDNSIYKSTDRGLTFQSIKLPFISNGVIGAINKDTVIVSCLDGLYFTMTGGLFWEKFKLSTYFPVNQISFSPPNKLIAVGDSGYILKTNNVLQATRIPVSIFSVLGNLDTLCLGDSVLLQNKTITGYSYDWKINGVTFSNAYSPGYLPMLTGGTNVVSLTASSDSGSTTWADTLHVIDHSFNSTIMSVYTDTVCMGTRLTIAVPNSQRFVKYQLRINNANLGPPQFGNGSALYFNSFFALASDTVFEMIAVKTSPCFSDTLITYKTIHLCDSIGGSVTGICILQSTSCPVIMDDPGITHVKLANLDNPSYCFFSNYSDYSCFKNADVFLGSTYAMSVSINAAMGESIMVWIDYNGDGLLNTSENVYTGGGTTMASFNITIPNNAMMGKKLRMRVMSDKDFPQTGACSAEACSDGEIEDYSVTIMPALVAPLSSFTKVVTVACSTKVVFTNTSYNALSYLWDFGDNTTSTLASPTHYFTATGSYSIKLIAYNPTGTDTSTQLINVVMPIVPIAATCTQNLNCSPSFLVGITQITYQNVSYNLSGLSHDYTCKVLFNLIEGATFVPVVSGISGYSYNIFLDNDNNGSFTNAEIMPSGSWISSSSPSVQIHKTVPTYAALYVPLRMRIVMFDNLFSNVCGAYCGDYKDITVIIRPVPNSVPELLNTNPFNIFPNPITDEFTIYFENQQLETSIQIINLLGNELYNTVFSGQSIAISTFNLPKGIYFVKVLDANKVLGVQKIVLE